MSHSSSDSKMSITALEAFRARYPGLFSLEGLIAGPPVRVDRLDRPSAYYIVPIRDAAGLRGIVQLDDQGVSIESIAEIRDPSTVFLATKNAVLNAVRTAFPNRQDWHTPFLAWRPCRESLNSMRPFWVVPHAKGQAYVTQDCEVFELLTAGRGG